MINAIELTKEQHSIIDAISTLINSMDDNMRKALMQQLKNKCKPSANAHLATKRHKWDNYPISQAVMGMTFTQRKAVPTNYKATIEEGLKKKHK